MAAEFIEFCRQRWHTVFCGIGGIRQIGFIHQFPAFPSDDHTLDGVYAMAAICNFFLPGLGHLILGKPFQGLLWLVLVIAGYICFIVPGIVLHIFCILDAARQSKRDSINAVATGMRQALEADRRRGR